MQHANCKEVGAITRLNLARSLTSW